MKSSLLPLALLASACASSTVKPFSSVRYPPKPIDCPIGIYTDASRVPGHFKPIARIDHSTRVDPFADKGAFPIILAMSREACAIGADAIILRTTHAGNLIRRGSGEAIAIELK